MLKRFGYPERRHRMRAEIACLLAPVEVDRPRLRRLLMYFMERAAHLQPSAQWRLISVLLTDDSKTAELNCRYFNRNCPTDVISFTYASVCRGGIRDGEIIINLARALSEGKKRGGSCRELALYLAHGCDHLHGQEDRSRRGRYRMRRRELRWIRDAARMGLVAKIIDGEKDHDSHRT